MTYTLPQGEYLIKLARKTIEMYLTQKKSLSPPSDAPNEFYEKSGVFVTLKKAGKLRGCIGRPYPTHPLIEAVIVSSIDSATRDPRFPAVRPTELDEITIELTILTPPQKIKVERHQDYLEKIKIGLDGLIVSRGRQGGLLLPQVPVEWKWEVSDFLMNTCLKAGLSPDAWLDTQTEIYKFQGIIFQEESPKGLIIPKEIEEK